MRLGSILLAAIISSAIHTSAATRSFAIFIDSISYTHVTSEVAQYATSIQRQGLNTELVVVADTLRPESIRQIVSDLALRKEKPIEGMVFIGDIAIPMILDAQHMASAFKADKSKSLERSSCPSDRYYDDLNLSFSFVAHDNKRPLLYYYSLNADSPQHSAPTLYSGRIKCDNIYGRSKYENLAHYLNKVVRIKERHEAINRMLLFSGSGYNSESILARIDEKGGLLEQFPRMKKQQQSLTFLDHRHSTFTKYTLMSELQQPDMSLALLHHHGAPDKEYINRYPDTRNARAQLDGAKFYFRSKIRSSVDRGLSLDSAITYYTQTYDVPRNWFDSVLDSASIAADSIYNDQLDLHIYDFDDYRPNARVVILDACFNGAFNNDRYIAEAYIFGDGDCVVAMANSVNSLQDKWCDKYIGLLDLGLRVGNLVRYNPYLEAHIIGDPTFAFASSDTSSSTDINDALYASTKYWKKQLNSSYPTMTAMAIDKRYKAGAITRHELLDIFTNSDSYLVRHSALMLLSENGSSDELIKAIELGLNDSYELIRRFSAILAGQNGSPKLIPAIIRAYANENIGERVVFQLRNAMQLFSYSALLQELEQQQPYRYSYRADSLMTEARNNIANRFSDKKFAEELGILKSTEASKRELRNLLRQLRNNPLHGAIDQVFEFVYATHDTDLQCTAVEALGWFDGSYRANDIVSRLNQIKSDSNFAQEVNLEAQKSIRRLLHQ
jgi:hypothetical protein